MKTAAVLGASGLIGQSLCELLSAHKVRLLLSSRHGGTFCNYKIDKVDLTQNKALGDWLGNKTIDVIFYLSSLLPHEFTDEFSALKQNLAMHEQVCQEWKKRQCHLIYASSTAVYGTASVPWQADGFVSPDTFYSISKLLGEQVFSVTARQEQLPLSMLRIKAPYGVKNKNKTVVNIFLEKALSNQNLELYGCGQRKQDFVYTKDVALAFWLAFRKRKYGIFNIASGNAVTMEHLARMAIKVTRSKSKIVFNGKPDPQENLKVDVDISKTVRELDFHPRYTLESGLHEMAHIYKKR